MADLTAADPVGVVLAWLKAAPRTAVDFGGPQHVSGLYEAPWPRLRVTPGPGGALDDLLWANSAEVTLEAVDHPGNTLGQAALWNLAGGAVATMKQLPEEQIVTADVPVVSRVRTSGVLAWSPLATGQGRWSIGVVLTLRPPSG